MEVDESPVSWRKDTDANAADGGKFAHLKAFVTAAREFEATHSEVAVNLMTRYLGLIASSCDLSIFSPGRSEVCAFFSALWQVMCDGRAPHWAGVAVLSRATLEPSARHALTHTYKFMPILSRLLSDVISFDKKVRLLTLMQDISYGIKISWQESYLAGLLKQLTEWTTRPLSDPQSRTIGHKSLTVIVNVCYGNLPAVYTLMRTVDTKDFVVHLISLKEGGYGGVEVCRLLLCLSGATRGASAARHTHVHSYISCAMNTLKKATVERDAMQLLHAYTFISDLCSDTNLRGLVLTYPHFSLPLADAIKEASELCCAAPAEGCEPDSSAECLQHVLSFITVLLHLELFSLRTHHTALVALCMKASRLCLPAALELFAAIVSQYRDEGRLPQDLISTISEGLPGLLVPPALEPGKAGLQWLQVVGALCDTVETQERLLQDVTPESFEDTLYCVLQHSAQNGVVGSEQAQQAVILGCRVGLALAPHSPAWDGALARLLAHHQVRKVMSMCLSSGSSSRRRQVLQLVKHPHFPPDKINQVFDGYEGLSSASESGLEGRCLSARSLEAGTEGDGWGAGQALMPAQEDALDQLIARLNTALQGNQISDIATSSVMELYGYKMTCLEQRLHSHSVALQGATEHMASLQHTLAMLQATNSTQQDVLYTTQTQNEKHKETIDKLQKQLEDAERTLRGYRAKLATERLDKESQLASLQKEFKAQLTSVEGELRQREQEAADRQRRVEALQADQKSLQKKLEQQTNKNSELAGVLIKFEERVKQRDRRLEEAALLEAGLRKDMDVKDMNIKQLEKTVLERENRLYQVTAQLEEMKRVQEMVAKLMSSKNNAVS